MIDNPQSRKPAREWYIDIDRCRIASPGATRTWEGIHVREVTEEPTAEMRDGMAAEECFEYHGCFTGDCPHPTARECGLHMFKSGWDAAMKAKGKV